MRVITLASQGASKDNVIERAFAAYHRSVKREGYVFQQPANDSYLCEHEGRKYVVLHNCNGVLAVYRVRPDGMLKGLRRWPAEVIGDIYAEWVAPGGGS